jgi:hypothetical protein
VRSWAHRHLPETSVFALALAVRVITVAISPGGFNGTPGYDQSVYYAAAASLLHGRVPYHDFVLLHPPMIMLVLLPAAALGHWTSDRIGFDTANISFGVLGALNAALVVVLARRLGLRANAATAGGVLYAVWFVTVQSEYSARLEPLANLFFLLALLVLITGLERAGRQRTLWLVGCGALFGAAANVKIWYVVPALVAMLWLAAKQRRWDSALRVLLGAAATVAVIEVPFLIASRGEMWTMVVGAQIARSDTQQTFLGRFTDLTVAYWHHSDTSSATVVAATVVGTAFLVAVLARAWLVPVARIAVITAVACIATLLVVPPWFVFYADFAAVPIAICAAAAAHSLPDRRRMLGWLPALAAAGVMLAVLVQNEFPATQEWGPGRSSVALGDVRCVTSDSPAGLIALDVLDRDLRNGCGPWVDTIGAALLIAGPKSLRLYEDVNWEHRLVTYLRSGQLAYLYKLRGRDTPAIFNELRRYGFLRPLEKSHDGRLFVLYRNDVGRQSAAAPAH